MKELNFLKAVASGNDFVILDWRDLKSIPESRRLSCLAKKICHRHTGVGADGMLVLERSKSASAKMRIFNSDGSGAPACGNGTRCVALYISRGNDANIVKIETKAGIVDAIVSKDRIKLRMPPVKDFKPDIPIKINTKPVQVNLVNTGVPHAVVFVEGLDGFDVVNVGRQLRYHSRFRPAGTNVDFVQFLNGNSIKIRTYERGVEAETLSCGTGAVAASLVSAVRLGLKGKVKINVHTKSGEVLKVYLDDLCSFPQPPTGPSASGVWLEGKAKVIFKGTIA
jgi:diaminopimelate epimerase